MGSRGNRRSHGRTQNCVQQRQGHRPRGVDCAGLSSRMGRSKPIGSCRDPAGSRASVGASPWTARDGNGGRGRQDHRSVGSRDQRSHRFRALLRRVCPPPRSRACHDRRRSLRRPLSDTGDPALELPGGHSHRRRAGRPGRRISRHHQARPSGAPVHGDRRRGPVARRCPARCAARGAHR